MRRQTAPFNRRSLEIAEVRRFGPYTVVAALDGEAPLASPGQFHMLAAEKGWGGGDRGRPWLPRAISFLSNGEGGRFDFLVDAVGPGTEALAGLEEGDRLLIAGPFGNGFTTPDPVAVPVLLGGGIGVAPVMAAAQQLRSEGTEPRLALGFRTAAHASVAELDPAATVFTDDGSVGTQGSVLGALDLAEGPIEILACGPAPMLEAVRVFAEQHSIRCQLALEAPMACGFGACFGCAVHTRSGIKRLCVEGPVLNSTVLDFVSADGRLPG